MGLDGVELLLDVEQAFGISISDEDAMRTRTVGDLYELIVRSMDVDSPQQRQVCLTSATFYRIRRALRAVMEIKRSQIRPEVLTDSILPRRRRHLLWLELEEQLRLRLPYLVRPKWLVAILAVFTASVASAIQRTTSARSVPPTRCCWPRALP